ncbi:hypothetical protein MKX01_010560 [Papaver californicum]|nr:hypothetical protein MKX01_010560 [Papaver californicum]
MNLCNVKVLKISGAYFKVEISDKVNENSLTFNKVPRCLECLQSIEIEMFNGYPKELEMVKFVLKHARVLQTVILETSYTVEDYMDPRKKKRDLKAKDVEALNKKIVSLSFQAPKSCFFLLLANYRIGCDIRLLLLSAIKLEVN